MAQQSDRENSAQPENRTARIVLASNLRIIRLLRNLSQETLADLSGLDRSYVGSIERAERSVGLDSLEKLAGALGVTIAELLAVPDPNQLASELVHSVQNLVDKASAKTR